MTKRRLYEDFDFTYRLGAFCLIGFLLLVMAGHIQRTEPRPMLSPVPIIEAQEITEVLPTPIPSEKDQVIAEIQRVFGEHSEKAFLLLLGKDDKSCAENRMLRADAVNYNWTKQEGVWWSRDIGVFQINDKLHGHKGNLWDWKDNIRVAKSIFDQTGDFSAWVCGKWYSI